MNLDEIAKIFGVSGSTVMRRMKEWNIPRRDVGECNKGRTPPNKKFPFTKKELYDRYVNQHKSSTEIAREIGAHHSNVINWLRKYNIPRRSLSESHKGEKAWNRKFDLTREELRELYIDKEMCMREIGELLGLSQATIRDWLKKYDIPRRTLSEVKKGHKYWERLEYVKKTMERRNAKPNKAEKELDKLIQEYFPDEWKYTGDGKDGTAIGGRPPDWLNVNGQKKVIELFGEFYHSNLYGFSMKIPHKRTYQGTIDHYKKYGFKCLIIWFEELKNPDGVIEKIKNWK